MYNEFVKLYCDHYGLEIKYMNHTSCVFENGNQVGHFNDKDKIITFSNGTIVRKGDLILSILEGTNLHRREV